MKTSIITASLLATLATPCFAQVSSAQAVSAGARSADQPFFSGTIPVDPALAGSVPSAEQRNDAPASFFSGTIPTDPALPGTVRLSDEQREAALEAGAKLGGRNPEGGKAPDGKIHGEMGVEVGTGGYRSVYGTAVVPLGDSGTAAFSFQDSRSNYRRRGYRGGDW